MNERYTNLMLFIAENDSSAITTYLQNHPELPLLDLKRGLKESFLRGCFDAAAAILESNKIPVEEEISLLLESANLEIIERYVKFKAHCNEWQPALNATLALYEQDADYVRYYQDTYSGLLVAFLKPVIKAEALTEVKSLLAITLKFANDSNSNPYYYPLTLAIQYHANEIALWLLDRHIDKYANYRYTPQHLIDALCLAAESQNVRMIYAFLNRAVPVNSISSMRILTPLLAAVHNKDQVISKILLDWGADPTFAPSPGSNCPLHEAIKGNKTTKLATILLQHAKTYDLNIRDKRQLTLLAAAIIDTQDPAFVKLLLDFGADPNVLADGELSALEFACSKLAASQSFQAKRNLTAIIRLLLAKGADVNLTANWLYTPFMTLIKGGCDQEAELLLSKGIDFSQGQCRNHQALPMLMAKKDINDSLVAQVVASGADLTCTDQHHKSAIDYLQEMKDAEKYVHCLKLFINHAVKQKNGAVFWKLFSQSAEAVNLINLTDLNLDAARWLADYIHDKLLNWPIPEIETLKQFEQRLVDHLNPGVRLAFAALIDNTDEAVLKRALLQDPFAKKNNVLLNPILNNMIYRYQCRLEPYLKGTQVKLNADGSITEVKQATDRDIDEGGLRVAFNQPQSIPHPLYLDITTAKKLQDLSKQIHTKIAKDKKMKVLGYALLDEEEEKQLIPLCAALQEALSGCPQTKLQFQIDLTQAPHNPEKKVDIVELQTKAILPIIILLTNERIRRQQAEKEICDKKRTSIVQATFKTMRDQQLLFPSVPRPVSTGQQVLKNAIKAIEKTLEKKTANPPKLATRTLFASMNCGFFSNAKNNFKKPDEDHDDRPSYRPSFRM